MQWADEGIVLGARRHGEGHAILELMTRRHGRHLGLVYGGAGRRLRASLQPGNAVRAIWRARLDEHLGHYAVEVLRFHSAAAPAPAHVAYGVTHLAALCRLLPERDPHPAVHEALAAVLDRLEDAAAAGPLVARFELLMLRELGYGLDLAACALTGQATELGYVSPKSGRAVSRAAGQPWGGQLLRLPSFLTGDDAPCGDDLADAFALTGFFLHRHVLAPRGLAFAAAREGFIAAVRGVASAPAAVMPSR